MFNFKRTLRGTHRLNKRSNRELTEGMLNDFREANVFIRIRCSLVVEKILMEDSVLRLSKFNILI